MKIILWSLLGLFLIGDAFFILPYHLTGDSVTSNYYINYKKDSLLLFNVFPDSGIQLKLNMPPGYEAIYRQGETKKKDSLQHILFVNVSVFHNLDFTALSFPFYKVTTFNGVIPFYSIIKASNAPDMDSTALIGNIVVNGKLAVKGICTPLYARTLVENSLVDIIKKEMGKITFDINCRPPPDTLATITAPTSLRKNPVKLRR
ncbi:MAG: hypothetical protein ABI813_15585 [Bacteroidota bacterium]